MQLYRMRIVDRPEFCVEYKIVRINTHVFIDVMRINTYNK